MMFNYGCIEKHHKGYRKALRQCKTNKKRFGQDFDDSETWNLDLSFVIFLRKHNYNKELTKLCLEYERCRDNFEVFNSTDQFFAEFNQLSPKQKFEIKYFLIPRLYRFSELANCYPPCYGSIEKWVEEVKNIAKQIECNDFTQFLKLLNQFWW